MERESLSLEVRKRLQKREQEKEEGRKRENKV